MRNKLLLAALVAAPLLAHAADDTTKKPATPQRERMASCSRDAHAKGLKGGERIAPTGALFISNASIQGAAD